MVVCSFILNTINSTLKVFFKGKLGVDKPIMFNSLSKMLQAVSSVFLLYLIAKFSSKEEQGYYYTFASILALQVFFELGFNGILTQFVAHEKAHLMYDSNDQLYGDKRNLSRLSSLISFIIKIFSWLTPLYFLVILLAGYLFFNFFSESDNTLKWQLPWILFVFSSSLLFLSSPFVAYLEGLGKIVYISKVRLLQQLAFTLTSCILVASNNSLYALGISSLTSFLVLYLSLRNSSVWSLMKKLYSTEKIEKVSYMQEIFPLQWKIALSWISGYFLFQLFNPILFAIEGPNMAGRMGATLQALNGISSLSMLWVTTKVPIFSEMIAKRDYVNLDSLFFKTVKNVLLVNFLLLLIFVAFIVGLEFFEIKLYERFIPLFPLILFCFTTFINQLIFNWSVYLRCHKKEPLLYSSILISIANLIVLYLSGSKAGLIGIAIGYTSVTLLLALPWNYIIFKTKKKEYSLDLLPKY